MVRASTTLTNVFTERGPRPRAAIAILARRADAARATGHPGLILLTALVAVAAGARGAGAQPAPSPEPSVAAAQLLDEGHRLAAAGDLQAACAKLEFSLGLADTLDARLNLAVCYERLGKLAGAWEQYRASAELAARLRAAPHEKYARERADALRPRLPRLILRAPDAGAAAGLVVSRNGAPVERSLLGGVVFVDPGRHSIEAIAGGHLLFATTVLATEGIETVVDLPAPGPGSRPPPAAAAPPGRGPSAYTPATPAPERAGAIDRPATAPSAPVVTVQRKTVNRRYWSWILLGDLSSLGLTALTSEEILLPALSVSAPIVHLLNHNPRLALGSLALRGLSSVALRGGISAVDDPDGTTTGGRLMTLGVLGLACAMIVDYSLATKQVVIEERSTSLIEHAGVSANPTLSQTPRGDVLLGLVGSF